MLTKNENIRLQIETITSEGLGLGRIDGFVVFVPYSAVGDLLEVKILRVEKSHAYGRIVDIIGRSPDRITVDCEAFGKCGGCAFRHLSYEAELKAKSGFVYDAFTRIGRLSPEFRPIIGSEKIDKYRNKAQYPLGKNENGEAIYGFYAGRSHRIIPCDGCKLHPPVFAEIADFVLDFIRKNKLSVYDEEQNVGVLRHICIRGGHYLGEINVTIVARRKIPELLPLSRMLMEKFPAVKGVVLNLNKDKTNVVFGENSLVLAGKSEITDKMCSNYITVSPLSFHQINTPAAEGLYEIAREFAMPLGKTLLDLYCGTGTIGLSMASDVKKLIGVEVIPSAVENARLNAKANNIENAEFLCGDVGEITSKLIEGGEQPDIIILDPARKGCDETARRNILRLSPERIVMVSCNPATAARDCAFFAENGYKLEKVQPVDMFPRTAHVECVALMTKVQLVVM